MFDFFLELLAELLGLLLEAAFEFAVEAVSVLVLRALAEIFDTSEFKNPVLASIGYLCLGGAAGVLSLLLFPHPLVHASRLPGMSLIVCPTIVGSAMALVGRLRRQSGKRSTQLESFGYGFTFALSMAVVRFVSAVVLAH